MTLPLSGSITIIIPVALYILPLSGSITIIIPVALSIIIIILLLGSIIISLPFLELFIIMPVLLSIGCCCASAFCEDIGYRVGEKSDDVRSGKRRMDEMTIADISAVLFSICCFFLIKPRVFIVSLLISSYILFMIQFKFFRS